MRSTVQCNKEWLSWGMQQGFIKRKKKKKTVYEDWQEIEIRKKFQK